MLAVKPYLDRIGYNGSLAPDLPTLNALHQAHLTSVPFENLDIIQHTEIRLDLDAFYDKIVLNRRGGFCYELNGLFSELLRTLGYSVTYLSARVANPDGTYGAEFEHVTLLVKMPVQDQAWYLADVGFGNTFFLPMRMDVHGEQVQGTHAFRFDQDGNEITLRRRGSDGQWEAQYRFTLAPRSLNDFETMCRVHQTTPDSLFTRARLCTLATPDGRITLEGNRLIVTHQGIRHEENLESEAESVRILKEKFGIVLTSI
jgi:N-hydroxyarylamine O-acetyltransferase